ncbi:MAG: AAA family ATPase [Limisphaerales bacterium]|jgi:predicted ATPase
MRLSLKNVGKVAEADIELNGITVIAGENDTGKSTISRALFCAFNSLYQKDEKILEQRRSFIKIRLENFLERILFEQNREVFLLQKSEILKSWNEKIEKFTEELLKNKDFFIKNKNILNERVKNFYLQNKPEIKKQNEKNSEDLDKKYLLNSEYENIYKSISIPDKTIFLFLAEDKFNEEFNNQINNIYNYDNFSEIKLSIKNKNIYFFVDENNLENIKDAFSLNTEAIYIDDPFVLDEIANKLLSDLEIYSRHRNDLKRKFSLNSKKTIVENIITNEKLSLILNIINSVCNGEIVEIEKNKFGYKKKNSDAILNIENISAGLKTFFIIQKLLLNGSLEENGTLILDEPEIHLHPAWQLVFAELIVLIQKEFGMHILLNTHSPYFLNAIEVYAARHGIADKCKYYLAENSDRGAVFTDVSNSINAIYKKLARPFQDLENERYPND